MIGIEAIAAYIPEASVDNTELAPALEVDDRFLKEKIGVLRRPVRAAGEDTADLAQKALEALMVRCRLAPSSIEALVVVTQNPDVNLPHVSALVHGRAGLSSDCAAFDLSLGCSGYVYGLSVVQSFLEANGLSRGVLVTSDPYSKVVDARDRDTALLFGDAATATLIGPAPALICGPFTFGTRGDLSDALACREGRLSMNGREVFNFAATTIPVDLEKLLRRAGIRKEDVDCYLFHQGSRYIVDTLRRRAGLPAERVRIGMEDTGNTVSSSIPLLLAKEMSNPAIRTLVLSGFGVGLSWASCVCKRVRA